MTRPILHDLLGALALIAAILGWTLVLACWTPDAEAAYPHGHPCLRYQHVDTILGAYSTSPILCPPSSATHHFRQALRSDTMIQAPGSPGGGLGGGPGASSPGAGGHGATVGGTR